MDLKKAEGLKNRKDDLLFVTTCANADPGCCCTATIAPVLVLVLEVALTLIAVTVLLSVVDIVLVLETADSMVLTLLNVFAVLFLSPGGRTQLKNRERLRLVLTRRLTTEEVR